MKITKSLVEHAPAPQTGQKFIRDDELKGFALRVTASGAKSFVWEGRVRGRTRRFTLGPYPALTVVAARHEPLTAKAAVTDGGDPSAERKSDHRELTFAALAARYLTDHAKPHKFVREYIRVLRRKTIRSKPSLRRIAATAFVSRRFTGLPASSTSTAMR
jgi:hypothetical protein